MDVKKLFKNIAWTFVFMMFASLFGYIVRILLARNLTTVDFGLFYAVIGFFGFFAIFRTLGTTDAITHFIPKYVTEKNYQKLKFSLRSVFYMQILLGFIFASLFFIFAKQIAVYFFHLESATTLIRIHAITFFTIGFIEFFSGAFKGFQKPAISALYDPVRLAFVILLSFILIKFNILTVKNMILIWLGGYISLLIIYAIIFLKQHGELLKVNTKKYASVVNDLKKYAIPLMIGVAAELILSKTDVILLTFFKGFNDVALYEIAFPSAKLILLLASPFSFVLFPAISKFFFEKEKNVIKEILQTFYNAGLFLLAPIVALLLIYPELVLRILFSAKYIEVANATRIMTLGIFFLTFNNINFSILSGMGEIKLKTKILYITAFLNVIGDLILIPPLGYLGAIIVTATCFFILWLLSYIVCLRKVKNFMVQPRAFIKVLINLIIFIVIVIILKKIFVMNMYVEAMVISIVSLAIYLLLGVFVFNIINMDLVKKIYKDVMK